MIEKKDSKILGYLHDNYEEFYRWECCTNCDCFKFIPVSLENTPFKNREDLMKNSESFEKYYALFTSHTVKYICKCGIEDYLHVKLSVKFEEDSKENYGWINIRDINTILKRDISKCPNCENQKVQAILDGIETLTVKCPKCNFKEDYGILRNL